MNDELRRALGESQHLVAWQLELALRSAFRGGRHRGTVFLMSTSMATKRGVAFRVLDAMDAPHSGRILRLRLQSGEAPRIRSLKGSVLVATAPSGAQRRVKVLGFAVFGGKPSNDRLARTGRVDLHVEELGEGEPVGLRWEVTPA
jgi:hypothetical protein